MTKIEWVSADYDDTLPVFGAAVIVHLDNSQTLFFSLESKASDPEYAVLRDDKRLFGVETDGESIYWRDGPRLTFEEIMKIIRSEKSDDSLSPNDANAGGSDNSDADIINDPDGEW